jgi:hypothetical protein
MYRPRASISQRNIPPWRRPRRVPDDLDRWCWYPASRRDMEPLRSRPDPAMWVEMTDASERMRHMAVKRRPWVLTVLAWKRER